MDFSVVDLWNMKNLEPPPINSAKTNLREIDVKLLSNVLKDAIDFFNEQPYLRSEAAVLSRTIYRLKMKFRSSKDFKAMEKLSRALRAYLEVEISKVLKTFLDSVPQVYKANKTYLPTKHMMDFVLVRIQSLGKILARILETCKIVCQLSQQRLGLGHFWKIAFIIYGMSARIFVIVKNVIKYTCELYSNLVPYSSKLKNSGNQWLPDGYILPENLSDWLEIDWMDLETTIIEIVDEKPEPEMSFFDLIEDSDDDIEFCDEYVLVKDEPSFYRIQKPIKEETVELSDNDVDIGEIINLSDLETSELSNKENLGTRNSALTEFNNNVDVGEVINLSHKTSSLELLNSRERKRGKNVLFETPNETVNLSTTKIPQLKTHTKRKKLNPKITTVQDVIEIIDSPQMKTTEKNLRSTTEVIEIPDNSFNNEIINLSDIETPKATIKKGKKRKRGRNSESETGEFSFQIKNRTPNKKRKKFKSDIHNTTKDGQKLLQVNRQNVKQSKKKKIKENVFVGSKVHVGETNINEPKNQNTTLKLTTIRKPNMLLNTRKEFSSKNLKKKKIKKNGSVNSKVHIGGTNKAKSKNRNVTLKVTTAGKPNVLLNARRDISSSKNMKIKKGKKKKLALNNTQLINSEKRKRRKKKKKQQKL